MKNPGGYIMVDCTGLDLTKGSTPQTITGLYQKCLKAMATGKQIRACNCIWGEGLDVTPIDVLMLMQGDYAVATASTLQIWVSSSDVVTISNMAPGE